MSAADFVDEDGVTRLRGTYAGGGSQPVSCVLACDTPFDVKLVGGHDILWDALYDNLWDLDPLAAIPDGLGLTFAFDGSSSLVVPTEAGIWALSYLGERVGDATLTGHFSVGGIAVRWAWVEQASGAPYTANSTTQPLPTGTQLTHQVLIDTQGTATPSNVTQVYLSIVRLA